MGSSWKKANRGLKAHYYWKPQLFSLLGQYMNLNPYAWYLLNFAKCLLLLSYCINIYLQVTILFLQGVLSFLLGHYNLLIKSYFIFLLTIILIEEALSLLRKHFLVTLGPKKCVKFLKHEEEKIGYFWRYFYLKKIFNWFLVCLFIYNYLPKKQ